MFEALFERK